MLQDLAENETAALVDRYCYMDLWPCSSVEMRSIGYRVSQYDHDLLTV